jgi:DNA-binding NtrC family response regulator
MNSKAADRILTVCDAADTRTLFESMGKAGGQVAFSSSDAEALRRIARERFGLVIVDVDTPGLHSGEFFAKARTLCPMLRCLAFKGDAAVESAPLASPPRAHDCLP